MRGGDREREEEERREMEITRDTRGGVRERGGEK